MTANALSLRASLAKQNVNFRIHVKTGKSVAAMHSCGISRHDPIAVATYEEAAYFASAGFTDILYTVGIVPAKISPFLELAKRGCKITFILDNLETARKIASSPPLNILLEIDCDGHRAGLLPDSPELLQISAYLRDKGHNVEGVITHAGSVYEHPQPGPAIFQEISRREARAVTLAASRLKDAGYSPQTVSIGSTPTAWHYQKQGMVTEVRAGTHIFNDCVMHDLGLCSTDDMALSVLCSITGFQKDGSIIVDAGWTALSSDQGRNFARYGYGLVCDADGNVLPHLRVRFLNQEHGIIRVEAGYNSPALSIGQHLRILPVHACATASCFQVYHVLKNGKIGKVWQKC